MVEKLHSPLLQCLHGFDLRKCYGFVDDFVIANWIALVSLIFHFVKLCEFISGEKTDFRTNQIGLVFGRFW